MKTIAASIPEYFPSVSFFIKMIYADYFIIADDLQYSKHSLLNRTKIKTPKNWQWLTVPVITSKLGLPPIQQVKIVAESNWQRKHQTALKSNYKYAPYFDHYFYHMREIFSGRWESILETDMTIIQLFARLLRVNNEFKYLSEFQINQTGTDRIIELVKRSNSDIYLITENESAYIDKKKLEDAGIQLKVIQPMFRKYQQQFEPFTPDLSMLDVLFNLGNESVAYLNSCIQ